MGTTQSTTRTRARSADGRRRSSSPFPSPSSAPCHEHTTSVVNAHSATFGYQEHDEVANLMRSKTELSGSSACSTESESEPSVRRNDPVRDNLVMLPSALDPLGRKIRRITTDVVDGEEQLLLVKRRASAAKAIALKGYQRSTNGGTRNRTSSSYHSTPACGGKDSCPQTADAPVTPEDFAYLKVIGIGAWGRVVLVRNRRDDELYAMKVVSKRSVKENNLAEKILSERDVLGGTHHHSLGASIYLLHTLL